jgi:hypothetical protein
MALPPFLPCPAGNRPQPRRSDDALRCCTRHGCWQAASTAPNHLTTDMPCHPHQSTQPSTASTGTTSALFSRHAGRSAARRRAATCGIIADNLLTADYDPPSICRTSVRVPGPMADRCSLARGMSCSRSILVSALIIDCANRLAGHTREKFLYHVKAGPAGGLRPPSAGCRLSRGSSAR